MSYDALGLRVMASFSEKHTLTNQHKDTIVQHAFPRNVAKTPLATTVDTGQKLQQQPKH